MIISGKTDIGRRRKENQDTWRAGRKGNAFAWAVVCDGMGGQRAGRLASCTAISSVEQQFSHTDLVTAENPGILLQHIVEKANEEVFHPCCGRWCGYLWHGNYHCSSGFAQ